jgi:hypothetical protein
MAALYGVGSLSGLFHLALTRHQVCVEHGELIHAAHHVAAAGAPAPVDRPAVAASVTPDADAHEHCAVADHLRQAGLAPAAAEAPAAPTAAERSPARSAERGHAPIALLSLSPKHSPPAAA